MQCDRYCGRAIGAGEDGECGACGRGEKSDGFYCVKCEDSLDVYAALFLFFYALLVFYTNRVYITISAELEREKEKEELLKSNLKKNGHSIDYIAKRKSMKRNIEFVSYSSTVLEIIFTSVMAILSTFPMGTFHLKYCGVHSIHDFYPFTTRCGSEVTFPLYTLPLIGFGYAVLSILMIRLPLLFIFFRSGEYQSLIDYKPIMHSLCTIPVYAFCHAAFIGMIFYIYPYLLLLTCLYLDISNISYSYYNALKFSIMDWIEALCRYAIFSLSIVAIIYLDEKKEYPRDKSILSVAFVIPALFFIFTIIRVYQSRNMPAKSSEK